jgi:hypothetical protein
MKPRAVWGATLTRTRKLVLVDQSQGDRAKTLRDQGTVIRLIDNIQDNANLGNCLANRCCLKLAFMCQLLGRR